jgi:dienelactone hydrolase
MAGVLLFHHALGRTPGVLEFADALRRAGHTVDVPDLYEGRTFADLDAGVRYAQQVGLDTIIERGVLAAEALPNALVYAGFSLGVLPAQKLAQTRPGARGALFLSACVPASTFGTDWPLGVPVQVHGMDADAIFVGDGDLDAARALVASADNGELFLYSGSGHLFADIGLPSYDDDAANLLMDRVIRFLSSVRRGSATAARPKEG